MCFRFVFSYASFPALACTFAAAFAARQSVTLIRYKAEANAIAENKSSAQARQDAESETAAA